MGDDGHHDDNNDNDNVAPRCCCVPVTCQTLSPEKSRVLWVSQTTLRHEHNTEAKRTTKTTVVATLSQKHTPKTTNKQHVNNQAAKHPLIHAHENHTKIEVVRRLTKNINNKRHNLRGSRRNSYLVLVLVLLVLVVVVVVVVVVVGGGGGGGGVLVLVLVLAVLVLVLVLVLSLVWVLVLVRVRVWVRVLLLMLVLPLSLPLPLLLVLA